MKSTTARNILLSLERARKTYNDRKDGDDRRAVSQATNALTLIAASHKGRKDRLGEFARWLADGITNGNSISDDIHALFAQEGNWGKVADRLGVSRMTVHRWRVGDQTPNGAARKLIAIEANDARNR